MIPRPGVNYFDAYDWQFRTVTKEEVMERMRKILRK